MRLERLADHRAEGQVRHVMVVHHVEVDPVGAGGDHVGHLVAQAREVGGQDGRGDAVGLVMPHVAEPVASRPTRPGSIAAWPSTIPRRSHPQFLPEQSAPESGVYSFAYTVTVTQHRRGGGAADLAPLDHRRRHRATTRRSRASASSASSRCSSPASPSDTPAAAACAPQRHHARQLLLAWPKTANASTWPFRCSCSTQRRLTLRHSGRH